MRTMKHYLTTALLAGTMLSTAAVVHAATVNLTATRQSALMPNGASVPMWGWVCGNPALPTAGGTGTAAAVGATCTQTNGAAQTLGTTSTSALWQPPLITVPTATSGNTSLTITLTNNLPVATSLVIVGQIPQATDVNGLGNPTRESGRPQHPTQTGTTWPIATSNTFTPPTQGPRARSFVAEAAAATSTTAGTQTYTWTNLRPGTYLIETGSYPSIQGPMGLYGVLVVTTAPTATAAGTAYPSPTGALTTTGVQYDHDAVLLLSEIDPVQNASADTAVRTPGFSELKTWTPACSPTGPPATANTCYPPAVDFTPLYHLVDGVAFDPANPSASQLSIPGNIPATPSHGVLLRLVNAGLRMHVPSAVGLPMALIAEDGNVQPDVSLALTKGVAPQPKVMSDVFMAAGKVLDVIVNPPSAASTYTAASYAVFDRELSLSANATKRDSGMEAFLVVNGGAAGAGAGQTTGGNLNAFVSVQAVADNYIVPVNATTFSGNVLANDIGVHNAANSASCPVGGSTAPQTISAGAAGSVVLNPDGSFTLTVGAGFTNGAQGSFTYCGNGNSGVTATTTFTAALVGGAPVANNDSYTSNVAMLVSAFEPGVLLNDTDPNGYPLTAVMTGAVTGGCAVTLDANGAFTAALPAGSLTNPTQRQCTFQYNAVNSQGTASTTPGTVTLTFPAPSGLKVTVKDANSPAGCVASAVNNQGLCDYKWIIEQDLTYLVDPVCQQNGPGGSKPATCPTSATGAPPTLGTNFFTSYMPVIAGGCTGPQSCERGQSLYDPTTGNHVPAVCSPSGLCTPTTVGSTGYRPASTPDQVVLNGKNPDGTPARYYLSILPGDSANAFNTGNVGAPDPTCFLPNQGLTATGQSVPTCGHTMSGAPIPAPTCTTTGTATTCTFAPVNINAQQNPIQPATITAFVFEDDWPLNGEHDGNGGIEPGLGGFQVEIWDVAGSTGDAIGQMTYDMFNMPLTNSLNGTIDPLTGLNACPIAPTDQLNQVAVGVIIVCPQFESDGVTPSPLVGQAVVQNLMPGRFAIIVHPSAAREAAGEEWLQTNTLDGSHFLDSFIRAGEPSYFQEFGPGGWHVFMGMANPAIINGRKTGLCAGVNLSGAPATAIPCNNTVNVSVSNLHMSRPPNETLFDSSVYRTGGNPDNTANNGANNQAFAHTTCYASLGDPDGADFAFAKCDQYGRVTFRGIPDGNWSLKVFDQWLDLIVDGSSKPVNVQGGQTLNTDFPAFTWQQHIWSSTYLDVNGNGIQDPGEPGVGQVPTRVRFRDGRFSNSLFSDSSGAAHFNETFPLFAWYVVESDTTRFRGTGVHVVNDAGGQIDGPAPVGNGNAGAGSYPGLLNSKETFSLPATLRVPGAVYCGTTDARCLSDNFSNNATGGGPGGSTGRIDPGTVETEGVQGFISQTQLLEWGKMPYAPGETGGIRGHVVYAATRPFDDPDQVFQNLWDPLVPNVTVNLYQENTAPDGTVSLKLIDTTQSSSWDAYAQGFRAPGVPNMSCPGQNPLDPFFSYTLAGTTNYLNPTVQLPGNGTAGTNALYKCYDGMHVFNQVQPAPYDGLYEFPSAICKNTAGGSFTVISGPMTGQTITCATVHNPAYGTNGPATVGGVVQTGAVPAILPTGRYVVEVVPPRGYEVVKEEDKNILIGDNYIAPVTSQFAGLGAIFIVPDQATVNSAAYPSFANPAYTGPFTAAGSPYNPDGTPNQNNANPTTNMGRTNIGGFGPGGLIVMPSPCVGALRIVPDYMSISPESGEVAPFAGASRRLCDRKEVTLEDQMQGQTDFFVWTKTPAATHFTGFILDDFSSEFDPASPTFGEKFAVPNLPVAIKDFKGNEISRIYSDQWGIYNGIVYSSWEVNPPNPAGYSPQMMITCMNDPGPITDTRPTIVNSAGATVANPTFGQKITDPYFNSGYSTFCYENPFMPADTTYLDTPVVPVSAFAEGYNPPDCEYPDATPAIKSVVGDALSGSGATAVGGPWVSAAGHTITITALGDQVVLNHAYSGPAARTAPYNQKFITRHYGFGSGGTVNLCTPTGTGCVPLGNVSWNDTTITGTVPGNLPLCARQQQGQPAARCGELVIRTAAGRQSIDTVTVTLGGNRPTYVTPTSVGGFTSVNVNGVLVPVTPSNAIQLAIDNATPGDLLIVGPGTYPEIILMWKPVRLQGIGATSVIVDANAHPAGVIDVWRRQVNCLFGLSLSGALLAGDPTATPPTPPQQYDPTGTYTCSAAMQGKVDPIPLEPIIGWNANLNGNIAELLQEPTLMGAYEGAAITVLAKGLENNNTANCQAENSAGCIPLNASTLLGGDCNPFSPFYTSNFLCNPARIDAITVSDSSQGGGGIFAHGWNHYLEVSNNRVRGNAGTLSGGITIGQAETADPTTVTIGTGAAAVTVQQPLLLNQHVNVHHNAVTFNSSFGDELNSTTPASAGGVTFCTGSDYYHFNYNWVCGNLSSGDGGGFTHLGFSWNADISHNAFLFNQSNNPTLTTWGGGLDVQGPRPDGDVGENSLIDVDVAPALTMGIGPGMTINSNLFQGNTAESGSGGGMRLQMVNGADVVNNPNHPEQWYGIDVTNNIFANNVAGWAGGGVSIQDAVKVNFNNNTVASNDITASAGVLFDTLGAPNSNVPPPGCNPVPANQPGCTNPVTNSNFQPAGFESHGHTLPLQAAFVGSTVACPAAHDTSPASNACRRYSVPQLDHDVFWQNRSFHITVGGGALPTVQLTPALNQATTGACPSGADYWDIGVQGDSQAAAGATPGHQSGLTLHPTFSILTSTGPGTGYTGSGNNSANPSFVHQYCNGSRVSPEIAPLLCAGATGSPANAPGCIQPGTAGVQMTVPPGAPDNNPFYPAFTLSPAATVDEGNNWINMFYGPLSTTNPTIARGAAGFNVPLGDYHRSAGQPAGASGAVPW